MALNSHPPASTVSCWNYRCAPPHTIYLIWKIQPRVFCLIGQHSKNLVIFSAAYIIYKNKKLSNYPSILNWYYFWMMFPSLRQIDVNDAVHFKPPLCATMKSNMYKSIISSRGSLLLEVSMSAVCTAVLHLINQYELFSALSSNYAYEKQVSPHVFFHVCTACFFLVETGIIKTPGLYTWAQLSSASRIIHRWREEQKEWKALGSKCEKV